MQNRKLWFLWAPMIVLVVGMVTAILVLFPREKPLLKQAKPIGSIALWKQESSGDYMWLTQNSALFWRYEVDNSDESGMNTRFYRYDFRNQNATRLDKLSALFSKTGGETYDLHVSPDGNGILWAGSEGGVMVSNLDGSHILRYRDPGLDGAVLCWLGDSHHWAAMITQKNGDVFDRAVVYDLNGLNAVRTLSFAREVPQEGGCFGSLDTGAGADHILGDTACWNGVVPSDEIVELRLATTVVPTRRHTVLLPPNAEIENILYSPQGDRVAWIFQTTYTPPLQALLHRLYRRYQATSRSVVSIWSSQVDGTQMHEVGHIKMENSDGPVPPIASQSAGRQTTESISSAEDLNLRWMTDGKHLSFIYHEKLWMVSTD